MVFVGNLILRAHIFYERQTAILVQTLKQKLNDKQTFLVSYCLYKYLFL